MADYQINLYDEQEAIQEDMNIEMGVFPDGGVFDADSAYRRGLITLTEKEASIEAYKTGGRPIWEEE
ncbi:hypothetical protein KAW48_03230 [candidate division WOR-3 bacterium]|nr:hypothetical protein [candidate division WOR-3 bacterium]